MIYKPFELHTHTRHSDGNFRVKELMKAAKDYGYAGLALTDHNTTSGLQKVTPEAEAKTLPVIPGIEWTTYYGHMLVLGADKMVDWRFAKPDTLDESLQEIKAAHGVVGIAHPFRVGSPLCTGCHWDFEVQEWSLVDYIEVWSLHTPHLRPDNDLALAWWTGLLDAGHHLAITAGRDWHGPDEEVPLLSATYLGLGGNGEPTPAAALDALRCGRTYLSIGPELDIAFSTGGKAVQLGDTVPHDSVVYLTLTLEESDFNEAYEVKPETAVLNAGGKAINLPLQNGEGTLVFLASAPWYRIEIYGSVQGVYGRLLAVSSPIYTAVEGGLL